MKKPQALKKGDTIGIAAPASPFEPEELERGVGQLEQMGFAVTYRKDIFRKKSYLAGTDEERAAELIELFNNPSVKAILFARGGYGMMRVLPFLRKSKMPPKSKIVLGYSDLTALHAYLYQYHKWPTFYGPVVAKDMVKPTDVENLHYLREAITRTDPLGPFEFNGVTSFGHGHAEGILVGGCLSLVLALLATPYEWNTAGKILFLEDVNEKPYSVDRMLTQLVMAGRVKKVKGIVFGSFVNGGDATHFEETARDVLKGFKGPILFHFPAGHGPLKVTLPLGIRVRIDAKKQSLEYLEPACTR